MVRCLLAAVLALLATVGNASVGLQDSVTCSLQDYQAMFRQAHRQELERDLEKERRELRKEAESKEAEVKKERQSLKEELDSRRQRQSLLAGNWQLVRHEAVGACHMGSVPDERSMATYNVSLEFRVFEDKWTAIPIIDAQAIVADWSVAHAATPGGDWTPVQLGLDTLLVLQARENVKDAEPWEDHTLVTNTSGLYKVELRAFTPIRSDRQLSSMKLNLLHPLTQTSLRIFRESSHVHIRELSVEPFAHLQTVDAENHTDVELRLPSTKVLALKWRMHRGAKAPAPKRGDARKQEALEQEQEVEPQAEESTQATVVHDALHSIDDSVLETIHAFKYTLDSEQSLSKVEIHFPGNARVTSVAAHGMKTWRALPLANRTGAGNAVSKAETLPSPGTAVQVEFKSSVISKDMVLLVTTELEFDVEAKSVAVPLAICQGVLRQSGTLAVVKVANVEIYEQNASGIARTGSDGIPSHMRGRTAHPIVLAYKFLAPRFNLALSVIHHEELPTLEAVADAALYKALVVESQTMHSLLLRLQNTRRQYMEVKGIPASATLWTIKVNSLSTKPVRGRGGSLLVPLMVGSGSVSGETKTSVELAWLNSMAPLGQKGTLKLDPPRVDVPVSALSVELQFPESYAVNFTGSLRRVSGFSQPLPNPISYETGDDVVEKGFDFASMPPPRAGGSGKACGVRAKLPKTGSSYRFEELLVVNGSSTLSVSYGPPVVVKQKETSWLESVSSALR